MASLSGHIEKILFTIRMEHPRGKANSPGFLLQVKKIPLRNTQQQHAATEDFLLFSGEEERSADQNLFGTFSFSFDPDVFI